MKNILLLDDDPVIHELVSKIVTSLSYNFFSAFTAREAQVIIDNNIIDFSICDLFLEGDYGDKLSNDFIRQILEPKNIQYCRLTSAPNLIPSDCKGVAILDKREFYQDDIILYEVLSNLE